MTTLTAASAPTTRPAKLRLLDGPRASNGAETYASHRARLGGLPSGRDAQNLIPVLESSGLLGRGGAGFPVGKKWRSVAERSSGGAVVVANGAEGEPRSSKDRLLMTVRPHLVLDGAILAAEAVGAGEILVYVGSEHNAAVAAMTAAIAQRAPAVGRPIRLVEAPTGYVSGESSAVVHYLNSRDARPTTTPPRPYQRGVRDLPTLVQNVESLAHAALIARFGQAWYRAAGRGETPGTALVTVSGAARAPGVLEIEYGTPISDVARNARAERSGVQAVLLGGYFGGWAPVDAAWDAPLDPVGLARHGLAFGCGLVGLLPTSACGVWATAQIMEYMAGESARQCGPCIFGLGALAGALRRLAANAASPDDLDDIERWSGQIAGRGACHHPDGAVGLLRSGLDVFGDEFRLHQEHRRCSRPVPAARAG